MDLDKTSSVPLYQQIKSLIIDNVRTGLWPEGEKIPSERELGERFGVSRLTVRQALRDLVVDGAIEVVLGKGAFVSLPKLSAELKELQGFTAEIEHLGMRASSEILSHRIVSNNANISNLFDRPLAHAFLEVNRLRYGDGVPLAIEKAHFDLAVCGGLEHADLAGSVYRVLREQCGVHPVFARQSIEAYLPKRREMALFQVQRTIPCLLIKRRTFEGQGVLMEYVEAIFRGDRYRFTSELGTLV